MDTFWILLAYVLKIGFVLLLVVPIVYTVYTEAVWPGSGERIFGNHKPSHKDRV